MFKNFTQLLTFSSNASNFSEESFQRPTAEMTISVRIEFFLKNSSLISNFKELKFLYQIKCIRLYIIHMIIILQRSNQL